MVPWMFKTWLMLLLEVFIFYFLIISSSFDFNQVFYQSLFKYYDTSFYHLQPFAQIIIHKKFRFSNFPLAFIAFHFIRDLLSTFRSQNGCYSSMNLWFMFFIYFYILQTLYQYYWCFLESTLMMTVMFAWVDDVLKSDL